MRKGLVAKELEQALQKAFALQDVHQSSVSGTGEDHGDAFDRENEARANDQNSSSGVNTAGDYDEEEKEAALVLSSGDPQKEQKTFPPIDQDHDSLGLALGRAVERFGGYLHFDGNQTGARTLVDMWSRMIWR